MKKLVGFSVIFFSAFAAAAVLLLVGFVMIRIIAGGWDVLSWEFLTGVPTEGMTEGGIFPAIVGTFLLVLIMSVAGVPVGTVTAIYLSEYAGVNS